MATQTSQQLPAIKPIQFPIIEELTVDGYLLYPGTEEHPGLSHKFLPGVNVVVGINGIGKTTLLLLLYRMLTGDQDLRDGDAELGGTKRQLKRVDPSIFAVRVPDRAANATAQVKFRLGGCKVAVTRSLKTLAAVEVAVTTPDDAPPPRLDDLDDTYKACVKQYSGVDDFFDWVLILRYLTFYLEDRRSLVWDVWAQTEIFRIFFLQEQTTSNYKSLLNQALSADSTARNTQAILTREGQKLEKLKRELVQAGPVDLAFLRANVKGLHERAEQYANRLVELDTERRQCRDQAARSRNDAEFLSQQERELRERILSHLFPKLNDYGAFVVAAIDSLRGCVICGTQDAAHLEVAKAKLHDGLHCPLCNAEPALHEAQDDSNEADSLKGQLQEVTARALRARNDANKASRQEAEAEKRYLDTLGEKHAIDSEARVARERLVYIEQLAGVSDNESIRHFEERLKAFRETVDEATEEKNDALRQLQSLVEDISENVAGFKDRLIADFESNIKHFLAETCQLTYRTVARKIGQNVSPIPLLFPEFHVTMTSGVFRESGTPRDEAWAVSESQKEFIELAFRMALLSSMAHDDGFSLVIETPEANLDAVFMPRAGDALNGFAPTGPERQSNVIATSNLNGSHMIPSLLGIPHEPRGEPLVPSNVWPRVLNLLDFAAKGAALRRFGDEYQRELEAALGVPEVERDGNSKS
jgi:hypothetical protein